MYEIYIGTSKTNHFELISEKFINYDFLIKQKNEYKETINYYFCNLELIYDKMTNSKQIIKHEYTDCKEDTYKHYEVKIMSKTESKFDKFPGLTEYHNIENKSYTQYIIDNFTIIIMNNTLIIKTNDFTNLTNILEQVLLL